MIVVGLIFAGLAALLHVAIFQMESIAWTSERVRKTFGITEQEANNTKEMAFNQGFYNLFLAISVIVGIILYAAGQQIAGATAILIGAGSMFLAALVLFISSPGKRGAALKQGTLPLLGLIALLIGLAL